MDLAALDTILAEDEETPTVRADGWTNALSGMGTTTYDRRRQSEFSPDIVDTQTALDLWRGNSFATKLIETFPKLGTRKGFELKIQTGEGEDVKKAIDRAEEVQAQWKDLKLRSKFRQWAEYGRGFGGALMLLGVLDHQEDLTTPLNLETVRSLDWLSVFEADDFTPVAWYANPRHPKYNEPALFQIVPSAPGNDVDPNSFLGTNITQVHESRVIYHPGIKLSNRQVTATGHGDSILSRAYRIILDCGEAHSGIAYLLSEVGLPIYKLKGLAHALKGGDTNLIPARLRGMQQAKSMFRGILMDLEETAERLGIPLAGVSDALDRVRSLLASTFDMPVSYLFGESPGGLNSTGESDTRMLYDNVSAWVDDTLIDPITRVTEIMLHADRNVPEQWSVVANPLWQLSDDEIAKTRKTVAETDQINISNQIVEPIDVTRSRFGGDAYSMETVVDMDELERLAAEPDPEPIDPIAAMAEAALNGDDPDPNAPPVAAEADSDGEKSKPPEA